MADDHPQLLDFFSASTTSDQPPAVPARKKSNRQQQQPDDARPSASRPASSASSITKSASNLSITDRTSTSSASPSPALAPADASLNVSPQQLPPIDISSVDWKVDPGGSYEHNNHNAFNRQRYVTSQLLHRKDEYTDTKYINIWCGTYNVNAKKPPKHATDLKNWLLADTDLNGGDTQKQQQNFADDGDEEPLSPHSSTSSSKQRQGSHTPGKRYKPADIYIIGFQEIVDLDAKSFLLDHKACNDWADIMGETLQLIPDDSYELVNTTHLVGLALFVYVKSKKLKYVSDLRFTTVGVGIMGVGGNKGAVICSLKYYNSTICFVNTHLAAHQKNVKARNADYKSICKRAALLPPEQANALHRVTSSTGGADVQHTNNDDLFSSVSSQFNMFKSKVGKLAKDLRDRHSETGGIDMTSDQHDPSIDGLGIFDHDLVFWIGDNNYRIDELSISEVYDLIERHDWPVLVSHDQLMQEKSKGNAFAEFEEGQINFPPTYKYTTGTSEYDRREGGKVRIPAYCDRIQWLGGRGVRQKYYRRSELTLSDHKPVMALFKTPVLLEVESRRQRVEDELRNHSQEQCWPQIAFSSRIVELDDVEYDQAVYRQLVVKNVGKSVVEFEVQHRRHHTVDQYGEAAEDTNGEVHDVAVFSKLPAWLRVTPATGVIPIDGTITLLIKVKATRKAAAELNVMGDKALLSLLLLKCANGGSHTVGLRGRYHRTILGGPLTWLCRIGQTPITAVQPAAVRSQRKAPKTTVPYALLQLLDYLNAHDGADDIDLFKPDRSIENDLRAASDHSEGNALLADAAVKSVIQQLDRGLPIKAASDEVALRALRIILLSLPEPLLSRAASHHPGSPLGNVSEPLGDEHAVRQERLRGSRVGQTVAYGNEFAQQDDEAVGEVEIWCYNAAIEMPTVQYKTLVAILMFLRAAVNAAADRKKALEYVCKSFAPSLTFTPAENPIANTKDIRPTQVLQHFITNYDYA